MQYDTWRYDMQVWYKKSKTKSKLQRKNQETKIQDPKLSKLEGKQKSKLKALNLPLLEVGEPFETSGHVAQTFRINELHVLHSSILLNKKP
jgi:hypothetical protein